MHCGKIGVSFVYKFALKKFDFRGRWSATAKNRGRSKKTEGQRALSNRGVTLAVGSYFQRDSAPPPPPSQPGIVNSMNISTFTVIIISYGREPNVLMGLKK